MSESSGSSFSNSQGGSSVASSENSDARALTAMQSGAEGDNEDLENSSRGLQEGVFATIYTLTKNRTLETAPRLAVLKVVLEWLQLFLVLFNSSFTWQIESNTFVWQAIQWLLVRNVVSPKGYDMYVTVLYVIAALILTTILGTIWVALVLKGDDANNLWMRRLISTLQLFAMVIYSIMWPAILDFFVFMYDCQWGNLASGQDPNHLYYADHSCLDMPHLAHMVFAGVIILVFGCMTMLMSVGVCDTNLMTRSLLASSDATTTFKILVLKMCFVVLSSALDAFHSVQIVLILICTYGAFYFLIIELPYYGVLLNMIWTGLCFGLMLIACMLTALQFTSDQHSWDPNYASNFTMAVLYGIFPAVLLGAAAVWLRMQRVRKLSAQLHAVFEDRKLQLSGDDLPGAEAKVAGTTVVSMMGDLKSVYRFKDVRQVSLLCRCMRKWDEDGVPDAQAAEFGEFILKSAMARMPNNPALLVMFTNYLIEVRKDGQAARTQLQLAQKAAPSLLDQFNIYMAQQLAKLLKRESGDTLDLMSYIEYQRNYRACVRVHKMALMAQRQFWNSLLRDTIAFRDVQKSLEVMEAAESRATAMYRRVLERYPNNGKLLKVYGRFLEYVSNDPWTAGRCYDEALKLGTTESLLSMTQGQAGSESLAAAGTVNEKVDGLVIINAQGVILMINTAALGMFGYDKGELEGKNVSVLMPQPFSSHHNAFMQRYISTGRAHILNRHRQLVALHKDRSAFPIVLFATRLSGMGSDTLFMGVVRRPAPIADAGGAGVRFWGTANGTILCADSTVVDNLGYKASDLVGQNFTNLCTGNLEHISRFIAAFSEQKSEVSSDGVKTQDCIQAQMLHAFLPPIDVEVTLELAGAVDTSTDCRSVVLQARMLSDAGAVLVLDRKGRVTYVTEKLAAMLGYPVTSLVKMELNSLLPQPYCQMHGAWFKDLTKKAGPTSCRSGGVVHLLAANGTKVPVTLKMSVREAQDSSGGMMHVVHVTRASEKQRLDQTRLLLGLNHKGTILEVNADAPKSLYGFDVAELLGRPMASVIDVFGMWRHEFNEDNSLLSLLTLQALKEGSSALASQNDNSMHASGTSWRVGVHLPVKDSEIISHAVRLADERKTSKGGLSEAGGTTSLLHALQQRHRLHAACMSLEVLERDDRVLGEDEAIADATPVVQVSLYRSDALTATIELDKHLGIVRSDDAMGFIFGISAKALLKKSFSRLVGLPESTTFEDLLGTKGPAVKKGAMRKSASGGPPAAGTSRMGLVRKLTAHHLSDGKPLHIEIQAMTYETNGKVRFLVRVQLHEPSSASMEALVQLCKNGKAADAAAIATAALADADAAAAARSHGGAAAEADNDDEDANSMLAGASQHKPVNSQDSLNRTSEWVREASSLPMTSPRRHAGEPGESGMAIKQHKGSRPGASNSQEGYDPTVFVSVKQRGLAVSKGGDGGEYDRKGKEYAASLGSIAESGSIAAGSSAGDGASEVGGASVSSAADTGHDEDLAVDTRRAKRLKKLNRMLHSSVAQVATNRWRWHTLGLLAVILVAHVVCFVVLVTQINRRYQNANNVADMTRGMSRFQMMVLRANFIQKCKEPVFADMWACNPDNKKRYVTSLSKSNEMAHTVHQSLYLGVSGLQPFDDDRLMDYWTYKPLPEYNFYPSYVAPNGTLLHDVTIENHRTLWEMGNVMVSAGRDLYFAAAASGPEMKSTPIWQYLYQNGPKSMFDGYAWSVDTFVDYAWQDLLSLAVMLIILLVVEALVVQMSCMAYEFRLVQQCNVSHMRLFSVFLALPSATVRLMAQRQLQVDDDTKDELDEDELELADVAVVAAGNEAGEASAKKSVRMDVDEIADEDGEKQDRGWKDHKKQSRRGVDDVEGSDDDRPATKSKQKGANNSKANRKSQLKGFALARKLAYKRLFGWLDPKFKLNGKKLVASSSVVWRFMTPLLLWVAAVVIIFGVSYSNLQGLQSPLASLDTASHVLYRATRVRLFSCGLAFSVTHADNDGWRTELKQELLDLRAEYNTLLYGGHMKLMANVTFDPVAPASAFADEAISNLFFRTTSCLRADQSLCNNDPSDVYYQITHSGLDAQINRYIDEMTRFANLPDEQALANDTSYEFALKVFAFDTYDGLNTAADLFVAWTISRFESVKQLHIILLVISLACMVLFVLFLYRPYIRLLHRDSKLVAGMLSHLPAEVDVEGQVKGVVLGMVKGDGGRSANGSLMIGQNTMAMVPANASMVQSLPGMGQVMLVPPGIMQGAVAGSVPAGEGCFGGRQWNHFDSSQGAGNRRIGAYPVSGNPVAYGREAGVMDYNDEV